MVSQKILVDLETGDDWIDGQQLTGRGLLGMFYDVLTHYDEPFATTLHKNQRLNPFTITPLFSPLGYLEQVQMVALSEKCCEGIASAWQTAVIEKHCLQWGDQSFLAKKVICERPFHLGELATSEPRRVVGLEFCSPTTFKAGPQTLPLPLSQNVFRRPFQLWNEQTVQQPMLQISNEWLNWCERELFIYSHDICTKKVVIHPDEAPIIGFVGEVWFRVNEGTPVQMSTLHALARFAALSGIGAKTAMGMGHVSFLAAVNEL